MASEESELNNSFEKMPMVLRRAFLYAALLSTIFVVVAVSGFGLERLWLFVPAFLTTYPVASAALIGRHVENEKQMALFLFSVGYAAVIFALDAFHRGELISGNRALFSVVSFPLFIFILLKPVTYIASTKVRSNYVFKADGPDGPQP